ncbi:MAG: hypothetical protein ACLU30_00285 [Odoribacter splanchnicus]
MAHYLPPSLVCQYPENISQNVSISNRYRSQGMRGEEALQKVITFLDEAVMLNYKE